MRNFFLIIFFIPVVSIAGHRPTCSSVTKTLFGLEIGPVANYPSGIREGLRREGTAELIAGVGFESLEGVADGITYPRIMVFVDRNQFMGAIAVARIASERDLGFQRMVAEIAASANSTAQITDGTATFECEGAMALSIEPVSWDDGPAIKVRIMDQEKFNLAKSYMAEYCADPNRRRPQDACKK